MKLTHEMLERLEQLEAKFASMGQDMQSYLDGLLYADYLTYWDYIHLDTLLTLQNPKTKIPDERIFIMYHQITELYFRLILDCVEGIAFKEIKTAALLKRQVERMNRYFNHLVDSFEVMVDGMDREEFLKFRMSLLPASGFQSAQFRMIEIVSTDFYRLAHFSKKDSVNAKTDLKKVYNVLYWKSGATELATGKKTLTLRQFEEKYSSNLIAMAERYKNCNLWQCYQSLSEEEKADESLKEALKELDINANVRWNLAHLKSAIKYLDRKPQIIAATGGTNWQEYLPPKNQRVIFFPELWTDEELDNWGKSMK